MVRLQDPFNSSVWLQRHLYLTRPNSECILVNSGHFIGFNNVFEKSLVCISYGQVPLPRLLCKDDPRHLHILQENSDVWSVIYACESEAEVDVVGDVDEVVQNEVGY